MPRYDKKKATAAVQAEVDRMIHEAETAPLPDIEYEYGVMKAYDPNEGRDDPTPGILWPHTRCSSYNLAIGLLKQNRKLYPKWQFVLLRRPKPEPWERVEDVF